MSYWILELFFKSLCLARGYRPMKGDVLDALFAVIEARRQAVPEESYVASLFADPDRLLKKIGEEAAELIVAAKNGKAAEVVHEAADLWFHTMVVLAWQGLDLDAVRRELARRFGVSGLEEKRRRVQQKEGGDG